MSVFPSLFNVELPLGRIVFLAWLVVSFLHALGVTMPIPDEQSIEFVLQAGILFGYFVILMIASRVVAHFLLLIRPPIFIIGMLTLSGVDRLKPKRSIDAKQSLFLSIRRARKLRALDDLFDRSFMNLADVAAMFMAFLLYSESMVGKFAPWGLGLAILFFIVLSFDNDNSQSKKS